MTAQDAAVHPTFRVSTEPGLAPPAQNEDAAVIGERCAVVIDGAGLPQRFRDGCTHTVHWYANALARALAAALEDEVLDMRDALATAIREVAALHTDTCDLTRGTPSATVAAMRVRDGHLEHLVLCDAGIVIVPTAGTPAEITDDRLDALLAEYEARGEHPDVRERRTAMNAAHRNRPGGFWVAQSDPAVAQEAVVGAHPLQDLEGAVLVSDGAARGYRMLGAHSVADFARRATTGNHPFLIREIREAEDRQIADLGARGEKPHDDATLVSCDLRGGAAWALPHPA